MKAISGIEYFAEVWKGDPVVDKVLAYVADLEAENERLKVCAQCIHIYGAGAFCNADSLTGSSRKVYFSDPCHFAPSRWTKRGTS